VLGSNQGHNSGYHDRLLVGFLSPFRQIPGQHPGQSMTTSFRILSIRYSSLPPLFDSILYNYSWRRKNNLQCNISHHFYFSAFFVIRHTLFDLMLIYCRCKSISFVPAYSIYHTASSRKLFFHIAYKFSLKCLKNLGLARIS
jgi:hypothetical protein